MVVADMSIYSICFSGPEGPWVPMFAWKPVNIKNRWYWLTKVFRREKNILVVPHQGYEYGDMFDVLRDGSLDEYKRGCKENSPCF
jgi:hypothetical protein